MADRSCRTTSAPHRRRLRELGGLVLVARRGMAALALATWSVQDPTLSHATDAPVHNLARSARRDRGRSADAAVRPRLAGAAAADRECGASGCSAIACSIGSACARRLGSSARSGGGLCVVSAAHGPLAAAVRPRRRHRRRRAAGDPGITGGPLHGMGQSIARRSLAPWRSSPSRSPAASGCASVRGRPAGFLTWRRYDGHAGATTTMNRAALGFAHLRPMPNTWSANLVTRPPPGFAAPVPRDRPAVEPRMMGDALEPIMRPRKP